MQFKEWLKFNEGAPGKGGDGTGIAPVKSTIGDTEKDPMGGGAHADYHTPGSNQPPVTPLNRSKKKSKKGMKQEGMWNSDGKEPPEARDSPWGTTRKQPQKGGAGMGMAGGMPGGMPGAMPGGMPMRMKKKMKKKSKKK